MDSWLTCGIRTRAPLVASGKAGCVCCKTAAGLGSGYFPLPGHGRAPGKAACSSAMDRRLLSSLGVEENRREKAQEQHNREQGKQHEHGFFGR